MLVQELAIVTFCMNSLRLVYKAWRLCLKYKVSKDVL
jgi:hypothetical protein